ncbi:MAG: tRNA lysidine(34) synthetase TilS [Alphaproteobacteria bacterium]
MSVAQVRAVFEKAMKSFGFPNGEKIAVAVSGGADSTALCLLAQEFVRQYGGDMLALIVDHGLRPCSARQARLTAERLDQKGIPLRLLSWTGEKPVSGIEQAAREARYRLLSDACRAEGCRALLLGHHRQDQAETFLIRRAKNSGPVGLAGMSAVRMTDFGRILRPLLGLCPADLREYNKARSMDWVEDETNLSDNFDRGRLRRILTPTLIDEAFDQTLFYGKKRRALEEKAAVFIRENAVKSDMGYLLFAQDAFRKLDGETALFCLGDFLRFIADRPYAPRSDSLAALADNIRSVSFHGATLGGCRIAPSTKKQVLVWRELNDLPDPVTVEGRRRFSWDRFSFLLENPLSFPLTVKPLEHRLQTKKAFPKRAFCVLPALFDNEGLFIVPHLGYKRTKITCQVMFTPQAALCETARWTCPVI